MRDERQRLDAGAIPNEIQMLMGEFLPNAAAVSKSWALEADRRCGELAQCVQFPGRLRRECASYCLGPSKCAGWLSVLFRFLAQVDTVRVVFSSPGKDPHTVQTSQFGVVIALEDKDDTSRVLMGAKLGDGGIWHERIGARRKPPTQMWTELSVGTQGKMRVRAMATVREFLLSSDEVADLVCRLVRSQHRRPLALRVVVELTFPTELPRGNEMETTWYRGNKALELPVDIQLTAEKILARDNALSVSGSLEFN